MVEAQPVGQSRSGPNAGHGNSREGGYRQPFCFSSPGLIARQGYETSECGTLL